MNPGDRIEAYYQRLNAHDAAAVAELFAPGGVFVDAAAGAPVPRERIGELTAHVIAMLPDLRFEHGPPLSGGGRHAVEWTVTGHNQGPYRPNLVPTGKRVELRGVDVFTIDENGITKLQRYFDQKTLAEQVGLQVIVEPHQQESAVFGYSMRVSMPGSRVPEVLALTWIRGRDEAERDRIRGHSRQIIRDFQREPGFIGIVTGFAGDRGFTVTAWEDEAALHRALSHQHAHAQHEFRTSDISPGVWTSVWKPIRTNRIWTRCPACHEPNDVNDDHRACSKCGAELPPRPPVW
jgi:ketosteroid isomerase-like protein